jgi:hypothetical protein
MALPFIFGESFPYHLSDRLLLQTYRFQHPLKRAVSSDHSADPPISSLKNLDATVIGCPICRFLQVMISRSIALVIATYINLLSSSRFVSSCSSEFTWGKIPSFRPGTITHLNSSPFA